MKFSRLLLAFASICTAVATEPSPRVKYTPFEIHATLKTVAEYEQDPERFKPFVTSVEGKVSAIDETAPQGFVVQLFIGDEKGIFVYWPAATMPNVKVGTSLKVLGNVGGKITVQLRPSGSITALSFNAYAYAAAWTPETSTTNYLRSRKELFDKWAEGSLFADGKLVQANP